MSERDLMTTIWQRNDIICRSNVRDEGKLILILYPPYITNLFSFSIPIHYKLILILYPHTLQTYSHSLSPYITPLHDDIGVAILAVIKRFVKET